MSLPTPEDQPAELESSAPRKPHFEPVHPPIGEGGGNLAGREDYFRKRHEGNTPDDEGSAADPSCPPPALKP